MDTTGWTRPFVVDDLTMPHLHAIVAQLFTRRDEAPLIDYLFHHALFTAKEAFVGFLVGASIGFLLGVILAQFAVLRRGVMPYVVASQTIPILAIAPIVVVGLANVKFFGWTMNDWERVAVISAYLTFFPVTVNTIRGLQSTDPRALELMHSYAASGWKILWKLRFPASLPFSSPHSRSQRPQASSAPSSASADLDPGRPRWRDHQLQPVLRHSSPRTSGRQISSRRCSGISFFLAVGLVERLVVRRAPEHLV